MKSFQWDDNFATGLREIDQQHQHLVDLVNGFGALLATNELARADFEKLFKELADYAVYHFDEEQALMTELAVDQRHQKVHINAHHEFLNEVTELSSTVNENNPDSAKRLLEFLTHWLAFHILGEDQIMAQQVGLIRSGHTPEQAYDKRQRERDKSTEPLLAALNGLFALVSQRNKELVQLNASLEEKVARRTRELSNANLRLEELSLTDVLTGLPNRRHAIRRLAMFWEEWSEKDSPLVCIMIDADHFKTVNDTYGHDAGDAVLTALAQTLQHAFRTDDVVCRLGGDEFFVICPNTDLEGGLHVAELVRSTVAQLRVPTGGDPWHGSVSMGVAARSVDMTTYDALIKAADQGVYAAKQAGKNCVRNVPSSGPSQ